MSYSVKRRPKTRESTDVFMIGQPLENLTGAKLPSTGLVLRRLKHVLKVQKQTISQAAVGVIKEVREFWDITRIPTRKHANIIMQHANMQHANISGASTNSSRSTRKYET